MQQSDRAIDWRQDDTATVLRKIRCADGFPGVRDTLFGREVFLHDAHPEATLRGAAGEVIACCGGALCRATPDGAVWIGHLRDRQCAYPFKLPATRLLADEVRGLPGITSARDTGYRDIWYEEGRAGRLSAFSLLQRRHGHATSANACVRPTSTPAGATPGSSC